MKQNTNSISFFNSKKRAPSSVSPRKVLGAFCPGKILVVFTLTTLLFGCGTTAYNIKSARELSNTKMLTGRFVFFNDDVHNKNSEGFTVFFKKREDKTLQMFQPDEEGYVFIPVGTF